ncbi:MAG: hypothetical protein CMH30_06000 [Micavibrio sp.]|nr:hypothetical protein [Micavibrio sp.]|tara:strand:- start:2394 stop:2720 length:327 start_codon:yes stop_codon:yes gene_type:complete
MYEAFVSKNVFCHIYSMKKILFIGSVIFLFSSMPSFAAPPALSCNSTEEEGAFMYDKTSKDFFFCRKYNKGWESLNQIVFILNGLLPLSGDAEENSNNDDMLSEVTEE